MTESAAPEVASPEALGQQRQASGSADADGVPALSASIAHLLVNKSALHAWHAHPRLNPNYQRTEKPEFDYGQAAHSVLLEGSEKPLYVIEADDWRTKAAKEARAAAYLERKIPLLVKQVHRVRAIVKAAQAYVAESELAGVFERGQPEQSLHWQEGATHCRGRADWLTDDHLLVLDYKTTTSANPHSFLSMAVSFGYTMQEAFYRRGVKAVYGKEPRFVFLLQEKEPPYACSLVAFDPAMQEIGDRQAQYAISLWASAMASGQWHGYPRRVAHLEPPAWLHARAEEWSAEEQDEQLEEAINP